MGDNKNLKNEIIENIFNNTVGFENKSVEDYKIHDILNSSFSNKEFFRFFHSARPESITPCELMGEILYNYRFRQGEFLLFISSKAYYELRTADGRYSIDDKTLGYVILYGDKVYVYNYPEGEIVDPYSIIIIKKK